jgi:hypothetical protein
VQRLTHLPGVEQASLRVGFLIERIPSADTTSVEGSVDERAAKVLAAKVRQSGSDGIVGVCTPSEEGRSGP